MAIRRVMGGNQRDSELPWFYFRVASKARVKPMTAVTLSIGTGPINVPENTRCTLRGLGAAVASGLVRGGFAPKRSWVHARVSRNLPEQFSQFAFAISSLPRGAPQLQLSAPCISTPQASHEQLLSPPFKTTLLLKQSVRVIQKIRDELLYQQPGTLLVLPRLSPSAAMQPCSERPPRPLFLTPSRTRTR